MRIGYGCVSTRDQHPEAPIVDLRAVGCELMSLATAWGKLALGPELDQALLRVNRSGDEFVVTKLARLGSLANLIRLSQTLQQRCVDLMVLDQGNVTSSPAG